MSKIQVFKLAEQYGMDDETLVKLLQVNGVTTVKNHMSSVELDMAERILKRHFGRTKNSAPRRVFISYAPGDEGHLEALVKYLVPYERNGVISLWYDLMVPAGEDVDEIRTRQFESADIFLFLISSDFLASDRCIMELHNASSNDKARLVPIVVRPCVWYSEPTLARLQALPSDARPITIWANQDEAWADVARGIRRVVDFASDNLIQKKRIRDAAAAAHIPKKSQPIGDIFRTTGQPDITRVEPAQLPMLRAYLEIMGQGLVVEGPSGVGKTTMVHMVLNDLSHIQTQWLLGQDEGDRETLDRLLSKGFKGHLVIDDFHLLDQPRQARIARAMKAIADRDRRDSKITVIGINPVGDSLVSALPDVSGRFEVVTMGRQPDEKVDELIRKGERAANIIFRDRAAFIQAAAGGLYTAQQLCYQAALKAGITRTAPQVTTVKVSFRDVVDEVLSSLEKKYFALLRQFACHDERTPPRGATLALLWLLAQSDKGDVTLEDVRYQFPDSDIQTALSWLKSSFLAQCFEKTPALRSLFYYNKGAGVLSIEDPRLAFYLRYMSWPSFVEKTGHQNARVDLVERKLVFSKRAPSDRPAPQKPTAHILHLSDLHFSQMAQAEVWSGQLASDLRELNGPHLDGLVLSGDLTQQADPLEFEAARRFLIKLSTEFKLSPEQVVIVPGNHDLSWSRSKEAYKLYRREDLKAPLVEGTYIAHGTSVVEVFEEAQHQQRFHPFGEFYQTIMGMPYFSDYARQFDLRDFPKANLIFLGLNSSWNLDHHFKDRAGIQMEALTKALENIRRNAAWRDRIKIAVWHHPLSGAAEDRIKDQGFMQQLAKAGFRLVLHGHIHKADNALYRYDMSAEGRKIHIVSAGTFGAPSHEWVPGYPLQYNLLRIDEDKIIVETRRREEPNGAWQPDARWLQGPGKDPLPRYELPW